MGQLLWRRWRNSSKRDLMGSMLRCVAILSVILLAFETTNGQGQANLTIRGRVTDSTGAVIPGVEVLASNTQAKRTPRLTVSDESGNYALPGLSPGHYVVSTTLPGLQADSQEINLIEGAPNAVDFNLVVIPIGECPGIHCANLDVQSATDERRAKAERILARMWGFSMQRSGFAPGNGKWRAEELRKQAITKQLHALDKDAIPSLVLALKDPDVQMRRNAALVLMDLAGGITAEAQPKTDIREALRDLIPALEDSDPMVRAWSAQAIGYIGPNAVSAVPGLLKLLADPDEDVRRFAQSTIARIRKK